MVADFVSDLGILSSAIGSGVLCVGVFGVLAVSVDIGVNIRIGGAYENSGSV